MGEVRRSIGRTLRAHPALSATSIFGLLVLALLWPALIGGEIFSPIAILHLIVPWQQTPPSDLRRYLNPELIDLPLVDYPWRFLARTLMREGTFPAWNPYVLGGIPFYSNPQTGIFSPFNLPLWFLPLTYGLAVSAALKLLAAMLGTFLLARELRLGFLPAVLGGIAFGFSAVNIVWLSHETLPGVVVTLPWAIWLVERIFERARARDAAWLLLPVAVGLGGGHPGMQVHLVLVIALYAVVRAATLRTERRRALRALLLALGGLAAGVLLMAFMLIPELRSTHDTVGVLARRAGSLPGDRMPFAAIRTVLFPDWWGRPSAIERGLEGGIPIGYNERTFYAGAVALLLACVGLLARGAWRRKAPLAVLGALGLAIPLDAPGLHWLATHVPVVDSVQAQRLHFAFAFAVALLAAFGLQALLDAPAERRRLAVPLAAAPLAAAAWMAAGAQPGDLGRTVRHFLTGADYPLEGVLALTSIAWFAVFALGVATALLLMYLRPGWRVPVAAVVVLLAAGDAYHFAHGYNPIAPASKVIPAKTRAIAFLVRHRGDGRIVGVRSSLPNDWPLVYGLQDARGYDPPQPTERMLGLWRLANPQQPAWQSFTLDDWTPAAERVMGVLGVRYAVLPPDSDPGSYASAGLRVPYAGDDAIVVENRLASPRALIPRRVVVTTDEAQTLQAIVEPRFDPRTTVAVEAGEPGLATLPEGAAGALASARAPEEHVAIVRTRNASVTLRAHLERQGLVVLDEALLEGWSVQVDGRSARPVRVNGVMRGVVVPAGDHRIAWSYRVPGLLLGTIVSVSTLAAVGAALAVERRRRRTSHPRDRRSRPVTV